MPSTMESNLRFLEITRSHHLGPLYALLTNKRKEKETPTPTHAARCKVLVSNATYKTCKESPPVAAVKTVLRYGMAGDVVFLDKDRGINDSLCTEEKCQILKTSIDHFESLQRQDARCKQDRNVNRIEDDMAVSNHVVQFKKGHQQTRAVWKAIATSLRSVRGNVAFEYNGKDHGSHVYTVVCTFHSAGKLTDPSVLKVFPNTVAL